MAISTPVASETAKKTLGVWIAPGLGQAWGGELKPIMGKLFVEQMAPMPWLPPGWLAAVRDLQAQYPNDLVRVAPSQLASGVPIPDMPAFITSDPAKVAVWQTIFKSNESMIGKFAANKADEGRAEWNSLQRKAAFWDGAYRLAVAARDFVPNSIGFVAGNLWNGLGWKLKLMIGIGVVGAGFWFGPKILKTIKSARG